MPERLGLLFDQTDSIGPRVLRSALRTGASLTISLIGQWLARLSRAFDSDARGPLALLAVFALLAFLAPVAASAQGESAVTVPNFWDSMQRPAAVDNTGINGIRFVTSDDFPPFNFTDPGGRLTGFNVDLARAICEVIAVPCTIQTWPFDDLLIALLTDRADAAIAGIEISAAARDVVLFSDVYMTFPARFVVRQSLPLTIDTLAQRTVAVVVGSAHEAFLTAFFPAADIATYPTEAAARLALRTGDVDLLFGDGMRLSFWLQGMTAGNCCQFSGGAYFDPRYFGLGMAVAVAPDRPDIQTAINAALRQIQASGQYASIYLRYFPVSFF